MMQPIKRGFNMPLARIDLVAGKSAYRNTIGDVVYAAMVDILKAPVADQRDAQLGMRREDVFINMVPVAAEDWPFGNGEASLVPA